MPSTAGVVISHTGCRPLPRLRTRRCARCKPHPRRLGTAPGSRSRGRAATLVNAESSPPSGTFKAISAGERFTCALRTDHTIACWGDNTLGEASPLSGTFKAITTGSYHGCAIRTDDLVGCWGSYVFIHGEPTGTFKAISAGSNDTCAIELTGTTFVCWGNNDVGQSAPPRALGIYYRPKTQSPGTGPPSRGLPPNAARRTGRGALATARRRMPGQPIANTKEFPVGPQAATTLGRLTEPLQRTSRIFAASIWGEAAFSPAELSGGAPTTDTATRPDSIVTTTSLDRTATAALDGTAPRPHPACRWPGPVGSRPSPRNRFADGAQRARGTCGRVRQTRC